MRAGDDFHRVAGARAGKEIGVFVGLLVLDVLEKRAAKRNVHHLDAAADSQDGFPHVEEGGEKLRLRPVADGVRPAGLVGAGLPI